MSWPMSWLVIFTQESMASRAEPCMRSFMVMPCWSWVTRMRGMASTRASTRGTRHAP
ncbi:MAG: hypothetical protein H6740_26505 [Alphaproteobacteria bacterium]|nr:hypothetical protein [Alphaproteobacteria bacterium]